MDWAVMSLTTSDADNLKRESVRPEDVLPHLIGIRRGKCGLLPHLIGAGRGKCVCFGGVIHYCMVVSWSLLFVEEPLPLPQALPYIYRCEIPPTLPTTL